MKGKDGIEIEPDAPNVGNGVIDICFGPCHDMCAMLLFRIGALYRRKQSFNMCGGETTFTRNVGSALGFGLPSLWLWVRALATQD